MKKNMTASVRVNEETKKALQDIGMGPQRIFDMGIEKALKASREDLDDSMTLTEVRADLKAILNKVAGLNKTFDELEDVLRVALKYLR